MTRAQQRAIADLWPVYGLAPDTWGPLDFPAIFGRVAPVILEIGFGDGGALLEMARNNSTQDYIGIEVHRPGVGNLLLKLEQEQLSNVRVISEDALEVLQRRIGLNSLDNLNLFFPDPWPKKSHHKRRIVTLDFIQLVAARVKPGGVFHFATDWQPYAEEALDRIEGCHQFANQAGPGRFSPRPASRPETKFEKRGRRLGHGVWDILMRRI